MTKPIAERFRDFIINHPMPDYARQVINIDIENWLQQQPENNTDGYDHANRIEGTGTNTEQVTNASKTYARGFKLTKEEK